MLLLPRGNDGGVLAMQRKFMRGLGNKINENAPETLNNRLRSLIRIRCCALSNEHLREPIVACELGNLYNKEAVFTALLERTLNPTFEHIRSVRDLIDCHLTANPNQGDEIPSVTPEGKEAVFSEAAQQMIDEDATAMYICPVTRLEMNAKQPFVVIRSTGWVLSDRAIREIGVADLQEEYGPFTIQDIIRLVPDPQEEAALRIRMLEQRAKLSEKKRKKRESNEQAGRNSRRPAVSTAKVNEAQQKVSDLTVPMSVNVEALAAQARRETAKKMESSAVASLFSKDQNKNGSRLLSVK